MIWTKVRHLWSHSPNFGQSVQRTRWKWWEPKIRNKFNVVPLRRIPNLLWRSDGPCLWHHFTSAAWGLLFGSAWRCRSSLPVPGKVPFLCLCSYMQCASMRRPIPLFFFGDKHDEGELVLTVSDLDWTLCFAFNRHRSRKDLQRHGLGPQGLSEWLHGIWDLCRPNHATVKPIAQSTSPWFLEGSSHTENPDTIWSNHIMYDFVWSLFSLLQLVRTGLLTVPWVR